jgi:hypothetical protein
MTEFFQLPQESIVDIYSSLIIEPAQTEILKQDLLEVISSFYLDDTNPLNNEPTISLRNIGDYIKDFDTSLPVGHRQRRSKLAVLINKKIAERKL